MASRTIINKIREGIERKDRRSNRPGTHSVTGGGRLGHLLAFTPDLNPLRLPTRDGRVTRPGIYAFPEWGKKDKINKSRT